MSFVVGTGCLAEACRPRGIGACPPSAPAGLVEWWGGAYSQDTRQWRALVRLSTTRAVIRASTIARDLSQHAEQVRLLRGDERGAAEALSTLETWQAGAPIGLGFVDRVRVVHMNEVLAATNGSHAKDLIGRTLAEVVPEIWPQVEGGLPPGN